MAGLTPEQTAQAIELGKLVDLAYKIYPKDPLKPKFPGYSGYTFVAWVQMQDFGLSSKETQFYFYGYILQKGDDPNSFVLVIRGTQRAVEFYDDFKAAKPVSYGKTGKVAFGFDRIFNTMRVMEADGTLTSSFGATDFPGQVKAAIAKHAAKVAPQSASQTKSIVVTGHSLGSALATLYVARAETDKDISISLLCTFASPLVGDGAFAMWFDGLGVESWRIVNEADIVPTVPPAAFGFQHIKTEYGYTSTDICTNIPCNHEMHSYLHLLDPKFPVDWDCDSTIPHGPDWS
jgi:hypothetical protein